MAATPHLEKLFRRWQDLRSQGRLATAEQLCAEENLADQPDLIATLARKIAAAKTVHLSDLSAGSGRIDPPHTHGEPPTGDTEIFGVSRFDQFRFLAKGGLGEVFIATDQELGRDVALKFIRREYADDGDSKQMFLVEGEVTARLEHPGVVPIYGLGSSTDDRPFFAMRLIDGETLAAKIDRYHGRRKYDGQGGEHSVEFHNLLARFVSVCNTIAYAHNRGVLHRDIKPENIMIGKYGETLVLDWGLAATIQRDATAKASGEVTLKPTSGESSGLTDSCIVGTPSYMSPEQADGAGGVGKAADIYSLGATLYNLLTNESPIHGGDVTTILNKVRRGEIRPLREVDPHVPRPLAAMCEKAMALRPEERYETALDLAADVERWLADEPVAAYREPPTRKAARWMRRHSRWTQAAVGALLATIVAVTAVATSSWYERAEAVNKRLSWMHRRADATAERLDSELRALEADARFLATRPEVLTVSGPADRAGVPADEKQALSDTFRDFIRRKDSYRQARLIDRDGWERIRVERTGPDGEVVSGDPRFKGRSACFTETMQLAAGEIYLSRLELNVEDGVKDWNFPVIRAAVPIGGTDGQKLGVVVINLHFSELAKMVNSRSSRLMVYLTNQQGEFLLHPTSGIGFCFERELDYTIEDVYPELSAFCLSGAGGEAEIELRNVRPVVSALVEPADSTAAGTHTLEQVVAALCDQHRNLHRELSAAKDKAVLIGLARGQFASIRRQIESQFGGQFVVRQLPPKSAEADQVVYCRKIFFDPRRPERFLNLVLALADS